LRLDPSFRYALYAAFAVLFVTGAGWLLADQMTEAASGEEWQMAAAYLLMTHGGAAMATLLLLGALVPLHVRRGWRASRNRITGTTMVTFNAALILTAFGLYYLGSEALRPWSSRLHIGVGLALPVLFLVHVLVGRRSS
jgi:predicted small integral membrane protein